MKDFIEFTNKYPELRFWQALRAFVGCSKIEIDGEDTYYWEGIKRQYKVEDFKEGDLRSSDR